MHCNDWYDSRADNIYWWTPSSCIDTFNTNYTYYRDLRTDEAKKQDTVFMLPFCK